MAYAGEHNRKMASVLQRYIGRQKVAVSEVSRLTGIREKTIRSHMAGNTGPDYGQLCEYIQALGPQFVTDWLETLGYSAVQHHAEEGHGDYHRMNSHAATANGTIAKALEDGVVDHQERPLVLNAVARLQTACGLFRAAHFGRGQ